MQLPRGKFHSIKNDAPFQSVYADIRDEKFTGFIHLYFDEKASSVVFENGESLLAEVENRTGTDAWDEILKIGDTHVNAELYALTATQVSLSLEFNQKCKVAHVPSGREIHPGHRGGSPSDTSTVASDVRSPIDLPKGTFHSLKIGSIDAVLAEISQGGLTGYGNLDINGSRGVIVFEDGIIKQAAFSSHVGKSAFDRICSQKNADVEAELYGLTPSIVHTSLERNPDHLVEPEPSKPTMANNVTSTACTHASEGTRPSEDLQLPRGTFHSTEKATSFKNLLNSLEKNPFTGYCRLVFEGRDGTVVLDEGICVMADIPPEWGDRALQCLQGNGDISVVAELYTLTAPQMELTREFNSAYRVRVDPGRAVLRMKPQKISEKPMKYGENEKPSAEITTDLEEQLHAMESTDFDALTDRFRDNFKDVLKRLQLSHLMGEDEQDAKSSEDVNGDSSG